MSTRARVERPERGPRLDGDDSEMAADTTEVGPKRLDGSAVGSHPTEVTCLRSVRQTNLFTTLTHRSSHL
jgi:hypothetical protein